MVVWQLWVQVTYIENQYVVENIIININHWEAGVA